jgi:hypothetical protein
VCQRKETQKRIIRCPPQTYSKPMETDYEEFKQSMKQNFNKLSDHINKLTSQCNHIVKMLKLNLQHNHQYSSCGNSLAEKWNIRSPFAQKTNIKLEHFTQ